MPRVFLLPISTRRALIYCEQLHEAAAATATGAKPPLAERLVARASTTWMTWEKAEKGWQKTLTVYGNALFRRIPFEEWGLKSFLPATQARLKEIDAGAHRFECLFPGKFVPEGKVPEILKRLATERQALHQRRLWTCVALMPVSAPFTLVPVIPNIPFFYLCFRAYSHYRAIYGSRLLDHLLSKNMITQSASSRLDQMYTIGLLHAASAEKRPQTVAEIVTPGDADIEKLAASHGFVEGEQSEGEEKMLLSKWNGKLLAEAFELPEMEVEIERAVEQVEKALEKEKGEAAQKEKRQE